MKIEKLYKKTVHFAGKIFDLFTDETEAIQPPSVGKEMTFLKHFMAMNEGERKLIGHNFTSILKACTFRGKNCLEDR